jgi:TonB family protein
MILAMPCRALVVLTFIVPIALAELSAQADPFTAGIYKPSDVSVAANVRTKVVPAFVSGKVRGSEGQLRVEIVVDAKGSVKAARIAQPLAGSHDFDAETLQAVKDWKFVPARKDDKPVPVLATVVVDFRARLLLMGGPNEVGLAARVFVEGADDEFVKGASTTDEAGVVMPKRLKFVPPNYPLGAMQQQREGDVLIEAVILPDGTIGRARVVRHVDFQLDTAALAAATQWVYERPARNGQPISLLTLMVLRFSRR